METFPKLKRNGYYLSMRLDGKQRNIANIYSGRNFTENALELMITEMNQIRMNYISELLNQ